MVVNRNPIVGDIIEVGDPPWAVRKLEIRYALGQTIGLGPVLRARVTSLLKRSGSSTQSFSPKK